MNRLLPASTNAGTKISSLISPCIVPGNGEIAYSLSPFVRCGFPVKCLEASASKWWRTRGAYRLEVEADPGSEVPFGLDSLILILLATTAWKQKSRKLMLGSAYQILRYLGQTVTGADYQRLSKRFLRLSRCSISIWKSTPDEPSTLLRQYRFFEETDFWFDRPFASMAERGFSNSLIISKGFCADLLENPVQLKMHVVRSLVNAPGALDLCLLLTWRSHCVRSGRHVKIPLSGPMGLADQLNSGPYIQERDFRRQVKSWLKKIKSVWPECPAALSGDEKSILVCHGPLIATGWEPPF